VGNPPSTYFFVGRLTDAQSRFQVQGAKLGGGLSLAVFWDAISVSGATVQPFDLFRPAVRSALDLTVAAYAFKTKEPIEYRLENWVEAQGVATDGVVGRFMAPNQAVPVLPPSRSRINTPWKLAARLNRSRVAGLVTENHVLALRDYQQALIDPSDNAFMYAWRAVEDICRAVSGKPDVSPASWAAMYNALQINAQVIAPLNLAAIAIRHNVMSAQRQADLAAARSQRRQTIDFAHQVVNAEMNRTFAWF
jgi:hypothetical protein